MDLPHIPFVIFNPFRKASAQSQDFLARDLELKTQIEELDCYEL
jgi:hypothetical protein